VADETADEGYWRLAGQVSSLRDEVARLRVQVYEMAERLERAEERGRILLCHEAQG